MKTITHYASFTKLLNLTALILCLTGLTLLSGISFADPILPEPPKIGSTAFNADDPMAYIIEIIRYLTFLALTIIVIFALIGFSSGLISEVNEARKKGEWGRFSIYFGAGLLVILVVIFGAWWGSERLSEILTV